jgi:hypothetical protein
MNYLQLFYKQVSQQKYIIMKNFAKFLDLSRNLVCKV